MIRRQTILLIALLIVGCGFAQNMDNDSTLIKLDNIIKKGSLNWRFAAQPTMFIIPVVGKTKRDNDGNIIGTRGLMIMPTGYYSKNYFKPLKMNSWNPFWVWGTMLIAPYIGVGTEYINKNGYYIGVGSVYIAPLFHFGKYF